MREIKFRVWKTEFTRAGEHNIGEMVYDVVLANPIWNNADIRVNDILAKTHNLMQFTGLFDKQGKEIYEGDIVEAMQEYELGEDKWYGIGKVEYYNASFIFRYEIDDSWALLTGFDEVKIIGSIYENPELLETK